jgi:hypothetical protein
MKGDIIGMFLNGHSDLSTDSSWMDANESIARNIKLTADDVRAIRASDASLAELANKYQVSKSQICNIRKRRTWRNVK